MMESTAPHLYSTRCCQLGLPCHRQQCGLAAASWAAALWKA